MVAPTMRNRYIISDNPNTNGAAPSLSDSAYHAKLGYRSVVNTYEFVKPSPRRHQQRTSWNH
ncbi:hypothetical protein EC988_003443, partial [Linderina pennispora]